MYGKFKLSALIVLMGALFTHVAHASYGPDCRDYEELCRMKNFEYSEFYGDKSALDQGKYGRKISIIEGYNESIRTHIPPYLVGSVVDPGVEFSMTLYWEDLYAEMGEKEEDELKVLVGLMSPKQQRIVQEYFRNSYQVKDKRLIEDHLKSVGLI